MSGSQVKGQLMEDEVFAARDAHSGRIELEEAREEHEYDFGRGLRLRHDEIAGRQEQEQGKQGGVPLLLWGGSPWAR